MPWTSARRSGSTTPRSTWSTTCGARRFPPRWRPGARRPDGPDHVRPARPVPAPVGVLAGRGTGRGPMGAGLQGPPLHGRRRLRHRPLPRRPRRDTGAAGPVPADDWRPEPEPSGLRLVATAAGEVARLPLTSARALAGAVRSPTALARQARDMLRGLGALATALRPAAPSSLSGPPRRSDGSPSRGVRWPTSPPCGTRWAARSTTWHSPPSPPASDGCCCPGASCRPRTRCERWSRSRSVLRALRTSATTRSPCSWPSCRCT